MVGAVGEMAYMKRRKLWKMGKDGLCCSSSTQWPCGVVVACLLHTQEVPGSIPGWGSYLRQISLH